MIELSTVVLGKEDDDDDDTDEKDDEEGPDAFPSQASIHSSSSSISSKQQERFSTPTSSDLEVAHALTTVVFRIWSWRPKRPKAEVGVAASEATTTSSASFKSKQQIDHFRNPRDIFLSFSIEHRKSFLVTTVVADENLTPFFQQPQLKKAKKKSLVFFYY